MKKVDCIRRRPIIIILLCPYGRNQYIFTANANDTHKYIIYIYTYIHNTHKYIICTYVLLLKVYIYIYIYSTWPIVIENRLRSAVSDLCDRCRGSHIGGAAAVADDGHHNSPPPPQSHHRNSILYIVFLTIYCYYNPIERAHSNEPWKWREPDRDTCTRTN